MAATTQVLKLDKNNKTALWRRAKARSLPINAKVEDLKESLLDLEKLSNHKEEKIVKEIGRL